MLSNTHQHQSTPPVIATTIIITDGAFPDPRRLGMRNVNICPLNPPQNSSSISATGFYQPIIPQDPNDHTEGPLTFKQLFEDLGLAFQGMELNADKDWSHPQNAYAAGLVLIMSPEDHARAVASSSTTAANLVVNLVDFSNAPVPVANYILHRHNEGVCHAVDSAEPQAAADCPALRALLPRSPGIPLPSCISNVSLDNNLAHPICSPGRSVAPNLLLPSRSPDKRQRVECARAIFTKSALMTIEHLSNYIESTGLDLPVSEADINSAVLSDRTPPRAVSFRTDVSKRDQCCRLTGQQNEFGGGDSYLGPGIDVCHIVPLSMPDEWNADLRLAVWSARGDTTLGAMDLDSNVVENGICLRKDLHELFDDFLWSVNPDTLAVRAFVDMECLRSLHGRSIRAHQRRAPSGTAIGQPPPDVWRWHYQQCVLRMLRACAGPS